jgi:hypothetical protein
MDTSLKGCLNFGNANGSNIFLDGISRCRHSPVHFANPFRAQANAGITAAEFANFEQNFQSRSFGLSWIKNPIYLSFDITNVEQLGEQLFLV